MIQDPLVVVGAEVIISVRLWKVHVVRRHAATAVMSSVTTASTGIVTAAAHVDAGAVVALHGVARLRVDAQGDQRRQGEHDAK